MAPMPTRRHLLSTILRLGAGTSLAGCLEEDDPPLGLARIELINLADESADVTITVTKGGESVYGSTHTLGTESDNNAAIIVKDWMGERVLYEVTASAVVNGNRFSTSSDSYALVGDRDDYGDTSCFVLRLVVYSDELAAAHGFQETCSPTTE